MLIAFLLTNHVITAIRFSKTRGTTKTSRRCNRRTTYPNQFELSITIFSTDNLFLNKLIFNKEHPQKQSAVKRDSLSNISNLILSN
jgi:hypothetical protein